MQCLANQSACFLEPAHARVLACLVFRQCAEYRRMFAYKFRTFHKMGRSASWHEQNMYFHKYVIVLTPFHWCALNEFTTMHTTKENEGQGRVAVYASNTCSSKVYLMKGLGMKRHVFIAFQRFPFCAEIPPLWVVCKIPGGFQT